MARECFVCKEPIVRGAPRMIIRGTTPAHQSQWVWAHRQCPKLAANECRGPWCSRCRGHVLPAQHGLCNAANAPWERTYFAQHGVDCPYQVA